MFVCMWFVVIVVAAVVAPLGENICPHTKFLHSVWCGWHIFTPRCRKPSVFFYSVENLYLFFGTTTFTCAARRISPCIRIKLSGMENCFFCFRKKLAGCGGDGYLNLLQIEGNDLCLLAYSFNIGSAN